MTQCLYGKKKHWFFVFRNVVQICFRGLTKLGEGESPLQVVNGEKKEAQRPPHAQPRRRRQGAR